MTGRLPVAPSPGPLEGYAAHFDGLLRARAQRGLPLLPGGAASRPSATRPSQLLPILSPSRGRSERKPRAYSGSSLSPDGTTGAQRAPHRTLARKPLDHLGPGRRAGDRRVRDRKWGKCMSHVGRRWLANIGKTDNGVVSVSSLLADKRAYYPLEVKPYTPATPLRGRQERPGFPHRAEDSRSTGASFGRDGHPFQGGGCGLVLRRGSGVQAFLGEVGRGPRFGAQEVTFVLAHGGDRRRPVGGRTGGRMAGLQGARGLDGRGWRVPSATGARRNGGLWRWRPVLAARVGRGGRWWSPRSQQSYRTSPPGTRRPICPPPIRSGRPRATTSTRRAWPR